jgi:hypothetical protein
MASTGLAKFGPEVVEIAPRCDTVQCAFNFRKALAGSGINLTKLCEAGSGPFHVTAFLAQNAGKSSYILVSDHQGSGGESTTLTVTFKKPSSTDSLCAEAQSESMGQALPPPSSVEAEWYSPSVERGECAKAQFVEYLKFLQKTNTTYETEDTTEDGQIVATSLTVTYSDGVRSKYLVLRGKARCEIVLHAVERRMKQGLDKYK